MKFETGMGAWRDSLAFGWCIDRSRYEKLMKLQWSFYKNQNSIKNLFQSFKNVKIKLFAFLSIAFFIGEALISILFKAF